VFSLFLSQVNSFSKTISYANFFSWWLTVSTQAVALSGYSQKLLVSIGVLKNLQIRFAENFIPT